MGEVRLLDPRVRVVGLLTLVVAMRNRSYLPKTFLAVAWLPNSISAYGTNLINRYDTALIENSIRLIKDPTCD